jgi:trehalose-6-phosphatase
MMSLPFNELSSARFDEIVTPGVLCAFDFDGTLAPIVAQPEKASLRSATYIGDDVTDEDLFRLRRPDLLSVRIGCDADSAAESYLHHHLDMFALFDELIRRLRDARAENWIHQSDKYGEGL